MEILQIHQPQTKIRLDDSQQWTFTLSHSQLSQTHTTIFQNTLAIDNDHINDSDLTSVSLYFRSNINNNFSFSQINLGEDELNYHYLSEPLERTI